MSALLPVAVLASVTVTVLLYLFLWPVPIEPAAWSPPPAPDGGSDVRTSPPVRAERLALGGARGPEDVAVDGSGALVTGTRDGAVRRLDPGTGETRVLARTGGRPLGLGIGPGGELFVCDVRRGLLSVSPGGRVRVRAAAVGGVDVLRANGLAVASDSTVYFTDSSTRWAERDRPADVLEHRPHGRLLAYDPRSDESHVVANDLYFPNGVALSRDESSALVVETTKYRVRRVRLTGPSAGASRVVADNLPGFPDGVSRDGDRLWVGLVAPRSAFFDRVLLPRPKAREVLCRLPGLPPSPGARPGGLVRLDPDGRVSWSLPPGQAEFASITNVRRHGDHLYLGSATEDAVGRIPRPDPAAGADSA